MHLWEAAGRTTCANPVQGRLVCKHCASPIWPRNLCKLVQGFWRVSLDAVHQVQNGSWQSCALSGSGGKRPFPGLLGGLVVSASRADSWLAGCLWRVFVADVRRPCFRVRRVLGQMRRRSPGCLLSGLFVSAAAVNRLAGYGDDRVQSPLHVTAHWLRCIPEQQCA